MNYIVYLPDDSTKSKHAGERVVILGVWCGSTRYVLAERRTVLVMRLPVNAKSESGDCPFSTRKTPHNGVVLQDVESLGLPYN
jgi:hypothetical protein